MSASRVIWADDGLGAAILGSGDEWRAHLRVDNWYADYRREPELAWVVSWLDPESAEPLMLMAAVEQPALVADDDSRRAQLVAAALATIAAPPATPAPFEIPPPTPATPDEWGEHLDLQIACWDDAFGDLVNAGKREGDGAAYARYRALTEALERIYAVDSSLNILWTALSEEKRESVSLETDEQARRAADHNSQGTLEFNLESDYAFAGYVRRMRDRQPYQHWSEALLAGVFQARFFHATGWTRGQLVHAATAAPMDLRQFRPGAKPRWKWRPSDEWARGRVDDAGRRAYDQLLASHDVIGLLGHLTSVFVDGRYLLTRSLRGESERGA
jgi:hypothetical protein